MSVQPRVVVGAVIVENGRVLAARRTRPPELAGRWEFPGGKTEHGEDPRDALIREIREELAATIELSEEVVRPGGPWPISETLVLRLYLGSVIHGELRPRADHDLLRWLAPDELDSVDWLPSDLLALPAVHAAVTAPH